MHIVPERGHLCFSPVSRFTGYLLVPEESESTVEEVYDSANDNKGDNVWKQGFQQT